MHVAILLPCGCCAALPKLAKRCRRPPQRPVLQHEMPNMQAANETRRSTQSLPLVNSEEKKCEICVLRQVPP
eukprot:CAMPEP_0195082018 /NCGR_PEP_ID=MMETSP0448-20130528/23312_1 /TAXON_ID=66468 /ORGANISM="Heterocapsa triquestra, Strain CCMP 448" /LENGTH=71 /DNA_ID=CAMNT_0040115085 /DNA_START=329 /DNA_END=541 /DNA_ORIENTATION=-